ncbi:barstar family protein [Streptomyces sp. BB1-1-1]|uniref:barstar family protein n=1 Tax=Streptomyces sp. BB1-1-1 TaxID=3074430 RepID=UPI0028777959|nr:barstar family protein [Streptomyces sp. BB1-1-1]WND37303.1 barstar family protein [Streptomyces sp. BB1-1-1]
MTDFDITSTSEPWVVFAPHGSAVVREQLARLESKGGRCYYFDSHQLLDERGIHHSFAKTLRFPGYYGNNWDALVDCLDDLCEEVTGGIGIAGVIQEADRLLEVDYFPLFVSVLCQGADRANSSVDLDGFPLDRPAVSEHFVFEFREFDPGRVVRLVEQPDLIVSQGDGFVAASLDPAEWH